MTSNDETARALALEMEEAGFDARVDILIAALREAQHQIAEECLDADEEQRKSIFNRTLKGLES